MGGERNVSDPVQVRVPGDKSISHRALLFASIARGESHLRGVLPGEDPEATATALRALGVEVPALPLDGSGIRVHGAGLRGWSEPAGVLDCGNSGTTARLLLGALAAHPFRCTLTGDASLRSRPMRRVTEPLARMGARFRELGEQDRLPIQVTGGPLESIAWDSPRASGQVKSAILLAGLLSNVGVRVTEPVLSRDHTERMLRACGATVETGQDTGGNAFATLDPIVALQPLDLTVPGDFSSAAFFLALGLLGPVPVRVCGVGLNPTRTGLLSVVQRMGGDIEITNVREEWGEPVGDLTALPSPLRGTAVAGEEVPSMIDEVPVLAMLAARAEGETSIRGAGELRVKESDRLMALATNLRALGTVAEELPDGIVVAGSDASLAGDIRTFDDHRIAMAFGILGAVSGGAVRVDRPDVVAVSFPGFWTALRASATAAP
jgi:3-phosphoshikimate 1-carboxyvinyltransferase